MQAIASPKMADPDTTMADMLRWALKNPFAWPGGYNIVGITYDGGVLCHDCIRAELSNIFSSYSGDAWHLVQFAYTDPDDDAGEWNDYSPTCCDNCGACVTGLKMSEQDTAPDRASA